MEKQKRPGGWRYVKKPGLAAERRAAVALRMKAADDIILGARTMEETAAAYGVVVGTVREWLRARKRMIKPRRNPVVVEKPFERRVGDRLCGAGGRMRDDEVRDATKALGQAIVALQDKLGQPTFDYRGRV